MTFKLRQIFFSSVLTTSLILVGVVTASFAQAINEVSCDRNDFLWVISSKVGNNYPPENHTKCFANSGTIYTNIEQAVQLTSGYNSGILNITTGAGFIEFAQEEHDTFAATTVTSVRIF